jgi:hypothetical protein
MRQGVSYVQVSGLMEYIRNEQTQAQGLIKRRRLIKINIKIHREFIAPCYREGVSYYRSTPREGGDEPMAFLSFRADRRELSLGFANIGELKVIIANDVLKKRRFTDVVNTGSEVAGNRDGCRLSIIHLHIQERFFHRVVMCACDASFDKAKATGDEVVTAIDSLQQP